MTRDRTVRGTARPLPLDQLSRVGGASQSDVIRGDPFVAAPDAVKRRKEERVRHPDGGAERGCRVRQGDGCASRA